MSIGVESLGSAQSKLLEGQPMSDDSLTNRRQLLETAGVLAAGGALLASATSAAAQVEDRASTIRITSVRGFPIGPKAYVKIQTSANITGWGEITGLEPRVASALAESLSELLVDENPTRIEHLWQKLYRSHRDMRG